MNLQLRPLQIILVIISFSVIFLLSLSSHHVMSSAKKYYDLPGEITFSRETNTINNVTTKPLLSFFPKPSMFEGFNNYTGSPNTIVPNIVHFIRFNQQEIKFQDAVCILAAYRNQNPDYIYFHTNLVNFTGVYWDYVLNVPGFRDRYKIKTTKIPEKIFGRRFSGNYSILHVSDVTRIRVLAQYGGIFLDNDSYLVRSLDKFRKFEFVFGVTDDQMLGTQVLVAHPDARFLKQWLETYREYRAEEMYYNAGASPTWNVTNQRPELAHAVEDLFGETVQLFSALYGRPWAFWRGNYAIHLLYNWRSKLNPSMYAKYPSFNETIVLECEFTFCEMAREAYYGTRTFK